MGSEGRCPFPEKEREKRGRHRLDIRGRTGNRNTPCLRSICGGGGDASFNCGGKGERKGRKNRPRLSEHRGFGMQKKKKREKTLTMVVCEGRQRVGKMPEAFLRLVIGQGPGEERMERMAYAGARRHQKRPLAP